MCAIIETVGVMNCVIEEQNIINVVLVNHVFRSNLPIKNYEFHLEGQLIVCNRIIWFKIFRNPLVLSNLKKNSKYSNVTN